VRFRQRHTRAVPRSLIESSAELKNALVGSRSARAFERRWNGSCVESGSDGVPDEGEAIDGHRPVRASAHLPKGKTV